MKATRSIPAILFMLILLSVTTGMRPLAPESPGATILVNTTLDAYDVVANSTCSLREAVQSANTDTAFGGCPAGSGVDTITFVPGVLTFRIAIDASTETDNSAGDLNIISDLVIQGNGQGVTIIDASYHDTYPSRIMTIDDGNASEGLRTVTIRDLTLTNGYADLGSGGAVFNRETIIVENVTFFGNTSENFGGGLSSSPALTPNQTTTVRGCSFILNHSIYQSGGAMNSYGVLTMEDSNFFYNYTQSASAGNGGALHLSARWSDQSIQVTRTIFMDNDAALDGGNVVVDLRDGAIATIENSILRGGTSLHGDGGNLSAMPSAFPDGNLLIRNSEISEGNAPEGNGGGIVNNLELTLQNTTISSNQADLGGGIYTVSANSDVNVYNTTIAYNNDNTTGQGDGIYSAAVAQMDYWNSLFAYNGYSGPPSSHGVDCGGAFGYPPSHGYNLDRGDSCIITASTGDLTFTIPLLGGLYTNRSYTRMHAISSTSPAVDGGNNATCLATDQHGWYRPVDGDNNGTATCDIGAYEYGHQFLFLSLLQK